MTPSSLSLSIGIFLLLGLPLAAAAADEVATAADLAELASSERQLRAEIDHRLRASLVAATESEVRDLADHTTALLYRQIRHTGRLGDSPLPAKRAFGADRASNSPPEAGNTTCTQVGHTLECVLRDIDSQ